MNVKQQSFIKGQDVIPLGAGAHGTVVINPNNTSQVVKYVDNKSKEGNISLASLLFWEYTVGRNIGNAIYQKMKANTSSTSGSIDVPTPTDIPIVIPTSYRKTRDTTYITLPRIGDGHTLDYSSEWSIVQVRELINQLIPALELLSENNIIHCDLKPENILIAPDNRYVISDLGCCVMKPMRKRKIPFGGTPLFAAIATHEGVWCKNSDFESLAYLSVYLLTGGSLPWDFNRNATNSQTVHTTHTSDLTVEEAKKYCRDNLDECLTNWYKDFDKGIDKGFEDERKDMIRNLLKIACSEPEMLLRMLI